MIVSLWKYHSVFGFSTIWSNGLMMKIYQEVCWSRSSHPQTTIVERKGCVISDLSRFADLVDAKLWMERPYNSKVTDLWRSYDKRSVSRHLYIRDARMMILICGIKFSLQQYTGWLGIAVCDNFTIRRQTGCPHNGDVSVVMFMSCEA